MKRKIIFISIVALIIIVIGSIKILKTKQKDIIQNETIEQDIREESKENEISDDVSNLEQEKSTEEVEIVDNTAEIQDEITINENVEIQTQKGNESTSINTNNQNKNTASISIQSTQTTETSKQEEQRTNTEKTQVETKVESNIEPQTTIENNTTTTKTEEYKVNNEMIQKIINTINANPSEYMKQYGYTIVVDSSIKEITNQFTFTENRVKIAIMNSFGTIRVYAEDYYVNGNLIMTECYII